MPLPLGELGKAITGQAFDSALGALTGDTKKPAPPAPVAASGPVQPPDVGSVILGQLQAMQKSLKEDQELVVQFRNGEEMLRIVEVFVPSPQVFVLSGNDGQQRLTRIITPAASVQLTCKVLRVTPGVAPVRLKIMTPSRPAAEQK
jgi:hypothetical protein